MPMKLCICGHHQNDGLHYRSDGIGSSSCDTDGSARHLLVPFIQGAVHVPTIVSRFTRLNT
jgi:hypothetical protein